MFKRDWRKIGDFEKKQKQHFLKNLTEKDSFKIFKNLYIFGYNLLDRGWFKRIDRDKIKLLSRAHSMFNKVKI